METLQSHLLSILPARINIDPRHQVQCNTGRRIEGEAVL